MTETKKCPICAGEMQKYDRYPNLVCPICYTRTSDAKGRRVTFRNEGYWGGFIGYYSGTDEKYDSHFCYVDGVKCRADEGHTCGIVIEVWKD